MEWELAAFDTEYIPEDAATGDVPGMRPDVMETYCEAMQIGACRLLPDGSEQIMNRLIKPHQIMLIPPWLQKMTGITPERRLDEGVPFPEALEELVELLRGDRGWVFSGDGCVLAGNCMKHGIPLPLEHLPLRVKPRLYHWGITEASYRAVGLSEVNSGGLHQVLGISLPSVIGVGMHDAAHDARSIAYSLRHIFTTQSV